MTFEFGEIRGVKHVGPAEAADLRHANVPDRAIKELPAIEPFRQALEQLPCFSSQPVAPITTVDSLVDVMRASEPSFASASEGDLRNVLLGRVELRRFIYAEIDGQYVPSYLLPFKIESAERKFYEASELKRYQPGDLFLWEECSETREGIVEIQYEPRDQAPAYFVRKDREHIFVSREFMQVFFSDLCSKAPDLDSFFLGREPSKRDSLLALLDFYKNGYERELIDGFVPEHIGANSYDRQIRLGNWRIIIRNNDEFLAVFPESGEELERYIEAGFSRSEPETAAAYKAELAGAELQLEPHFLRQIIERREESQLLASRLKGRFTLSDVSDAVTELFREAKQYSRTNHLHQLLKYQAGAEYWLVRDHSASRQEDAEIALVFVKEKGSIKTVYPKKDFPSLYRRVKSPEDDSR